MTMLKQLEEISTLMRAMQSHAENGEWDKVTELDYERQNFLKAFNPEKPTVSASQLTSQVQLIRELDSNIIRLAVDARQMTAEDHSHLKAKRSQCAEYRLVDV